MTFFFFFDDVVLYYQPFLIFHDIRLIVLHQSYYHFLTFILLFTKAVTLATDIKALYEGLFLTYCEERC